MISFSTLAIALAGLLIGMILGLTGLAWDCYQRIQQEGLKA